MKKRKRKINKKRILILILFLLIILSIGIYLIVPKRYGYQKDVINVFKEDNYYEKIKETKKYSKTLETAVIENNYKKEYFDEYLDINYVEEDNFINNINKLLDLGYKNKDINTFYEKVPKSIDVITSNKYDKNIINYISLDYFKEENLDRYIKYDFIDTKSVYDTTILKEKYNYEDTVTFVNAYLDKDYYSNDIPLSKDKASKLDVIVNKYYKLDKDYEPEDLTVINSKFASGTQKLRKEAADKFEEMASDMLKENLKIYAGSTYRSYSYQEGLYNRYVKKDGFKEAETYSARAGYSEHQLGLAVDIVNGKWNYLSEGDKEYTWLINNSYKYGFILRYPHESEYITGYVFEDWHFRYLGIDLATKVHESKLTYDEYIARGMLKEK
ncbi:MAG: M15 family metallopeptidase [Bacilli bacterium]|nr:M15 family metallopeptidase [Bacilli bacterium]